MGGTIVVGVDGSEEDERTLQWAVQIAQTRNASLKVALGYSSEPDYAEDFKDHSDEILNRSVAKVHELDAALEVSGVKKTVPAGELLEKLSEDADLVVVGQGHHHRLHAFVDGSVAHNVLKRATSAVLLVKPPKG
jgi:nucleotide-binding universal stress UspA family protein